MGNKETSLFEKFKETGKHGLVYGLGSVLQQAVSFFLLPLYTTKFTTSSYGILGLITVTGSVLSVVFTLGINYGLLRSYYDYKDSENRKMVITTSFLIALISALALLIMGIFLSENLSFIFFQTSDYKIHFILIVLIAFFEIMNVIPIVVMRMKMKSLQYIIFQVSIFATGVGSIIYLVNVRKWDILGSLAGMLLMKVLTTLFFYITIRKDFVLKISKKEIKKMLLIGLPLIPTSLSAFVYNSIDKYFLNYYSETSVLGLYNLAYTFSHVVTVLVGTPIALIWPIMYLSVKEHKNAKDFYSRALTYSLVIALLLFLLVSLLAKEAMMIFSNKEFWGAYTVLPIIVFTYSLWSLRKIISVAVTIRRKTVYTAYANIAGAFINIGLNFIMIPRYGMIGAAYATFISFMLVIGLTLYFNQRLIKIKYEIFRIIKIFIVTAAIFFTGYFVVFDNLVLSIIFKIIIILLFPFLLALLKFYTPSEIERVKTFINSISKKVFNKRL